MRDIKALGKKLGHNHKLARALWGTGVYEARVLSSFIADPARLTPAQMDLMVQGLRQLGIARRAEFHATCVGQGRRVEQQAAGV
jgi:3-methyladenine DNA glycosylase AlkD